MTFSSSQRQCESHDTLKALITDYFGNPKSFYQRTNKRRPSAEILDSFCDLGFAILQGVDPEPALKERWEIGDILDSCLLWCGAKISCSLVRYVVEKRGVLKNTILTKNEFKSESGENTVHVAVENGRDDVVDYLLAPWAKEPVRTPSLT
jgi:hypothetical protein